MSYLPSSTNRCIESAAFFNQTIAEVGELQLPA